FVQDLGSSNGTFVNNQKVSKHRLIESDTITVGGINLLFSPSDDPPPAPIGMPLNFSSEEVPLGAFGMSPGGGAFGASPAPGGGFGALAAPAPGLPSRPTAPHPSGVEIRDDDEEEAGEDYSLDASIVFDASSFVAE